MLGGLELELLDPLALAAPVGPDEVVERGGLVRFGVGKLALASVASLVGKDEIVAVVLVVNGGDARHYHEGKLRLWVGAEVIGVGF